MYHMHVEKHCKYENSCILSLNPQNFKSIIMWNEKKRRISFEKIENNVGNINLYIFILTHH